LRAVAEQLANIWNIELLGKNQRKFKNFNRSIAGGILDKKVKANQARSTQIGKNYTEIIPLSTQQSSIGKVKNNNSPDATDNTAILAIIGDLGVSLMDGSEAKATSTLCWDQADKEEQQDLWFVKNKLITRFYTDLTDRKCFYNFFLPHALGERGGSAIAKKKKETLTEPAERSVVTASSSQKTVVVPLDKNAKTCQNVTITKNKPKLDVRSGLLEKDNAKNSTFAATWPWQMIPEAYMTCGEPWAGHYSGSILEVLFMLDMLTQTVQTLGRDHPMRSWLPSEKLKNDWIKQDSALGQTCFNKLNTEINHDLTQDDNRKCKAALAAAFLISIGYHSAIEVKPTIWRFLGHAKQPEIFSLDNQKCDSTATDDIVKLMEDCTQK